MLPCRMLRGIGVYNEVRRWSPETKVVVFTGMTARGLLGELVRSGVDGLFMKNESAELLADALPLIMHGAKDHSPTGSGTAG